MAQSRCPQCDHPVSTPSAYDWQEWQKLACPNCQARLERGRSRAARVVLPLLIFSMTLPGWMSLTLRQRPFLAGIIVGLLGAGYIFALGMLIWDALHPRLQVRKKLPKPEITLDLNLKTGC
jgi:uncharacterized paraquat-inducible protein A